MAAALIHCPDGEGLTHRVAHAIGTHRFKLWFAHARIAAGESSLDVTVPNRFIADWIQTHFLEKLAEVAEAEFGPGAAVKVAVQTGSTTEPAAAANAPLETVVERATVSDAAHAGAAVATRPMRQRTSGANGQAVNRSSSLRYDLTEFAVGPSNELAYSAAVRLVDEADSSMSPLFIHGGCGLGKTHLLQGLCRRFAETHSGKWRYTTAEQFTNEYITAVRNNQLPAFRRRLRDLDLLAVDDVHFLSNKSATQTEFLHTFNSIDLQGAKLVLASDAHPKTIKELADALVSRFLSGMVVQVESPDRATRVRIIEALARRRGMKMLDGVAETLADHCHGSVREIEGTLTRLAALASLERRPGEVAAPIGQAVLQRLIGAATQPATRRPVRVEHILQAVCTSLHVERAQVMTRSRHRRVVLARGVTFYLARQLTTLSYPELAVALSRPNHSTVVTAAQRVEHQMKTREAVELVEGLNAATMDQLVDLLRRRSIEAANAACRPS